LQAERNIAYTTGFGSHSPCVDSRARAVGTREPPGVRSSLRLGRAALEAVNDRGNAPK